MVSAWATKSDTKQRLLESGPVFTALALFFQVDIFLLAPVIDILFAGVGWGTISIGLTALPMELAARGHVSGPDSKA